jgi:hypothetical protein
MNRTGVPRAIAGSLTVSRLSRKGLQTVVAVVK